MLRRYYVTPVVLLIFMGLYLLVLRACSTDLMVNASVGKEEVVVGEPFTFCDKTQGANDWLWQFGNNDSSVVACGEYTFHSEGRYRIRLTVNGKYEKYFVVNVVPANMGEKKNDPTIVAPANVFEGEYVLFKCAGSPAITRWEFGESGTVDSRERNPFHAYAKAGIYQVVLTIHNNLPPLRHTIEVLPKYKQTSDEAQGMAKAGIDLQNRLQDIIDGSAFNDNYNFILNKYLCGNHNVKVTVNNTKTTDFYSYCQGLRITGKSNKTVIESAVVDADKNKPECVSLIYVMQRENE